MSKDTLLSKMMFIFCRATKGTEMWQVEEVGGAVRQKIWQATTNTTSQKVR
jgi:hypothetical protein